MRMAAIYARVSSEQQREENTIASQTASLIEFANQHELEVPKEWVWEDEGYSGATLERPGLERVRDLAAEGQIQVVLAYSPDRLSRKYAYQILLIEEFARYGVETLFVKSPQGNSPEDQLLVQFQGMIAEYERAQILERSRRGKRHRAHTGEVSVMSGAPYGYRYIRKTEEALAAYIINEAEANVVRRVYEMYTVEGLSIGEITRRLNREGIPPRRAGRWERSVIWGMLRNPAYRGVACFGKTRLSSRTQTRPQRRRGITTPSNTAGHQRPREEWIEIPVPALVTEETFARAQELLYHNKIRSLRRTIAPSVVQGLVGCAKCGYALSRTSTQTSARKIHYYKCIGSDRWRKLGGPVCNNNRFIRQELLDQIVWAEVARLLEDPALIQQELDRRLAAARTSDPTRKREQSLQRELSQVDKGIERLLTAYQEELLSLEQLRERMPTLRQRQQALRAELQAITDQANDRAAFLRLAETLTAFLTRLRSAADSLNVTERQKIVRLLVKEILVGEDTITIRHSIPIPSAPPQNEDSQALNGQNYLLCKGRDDSTLRGSVQCFVEHVFFHVPRFQPHLENGSVHRDLRQKPIVRNFVEAALDVALQNPLRVRCVGQRCEALFDRISAGPLLTEPIGVLVRGGFHNGVEREQVQCLLCSIDHCGNSEWTHRFAIRLGYIDASQGLRLITPTFQGMYCLSLFFRCFPDFLVHTWGFLTLVFRHSSNGESFAAVGVGQETLQGFHLVPSTRLRCLHDTHLESANVAVNGRPVNGIPLCRFA